MGVKKGYKQTPEHIEKRRHGMFKKGNELNGFKGKKHTLQFRKMQSELKKIDNPMFNSITQKKVAESRMGGKNHNWKGGISKENRYTREYRKWRLAVLTRDNFTCCKCGTNKEKGYDKYMTAHHIKQYGFNPELRYDIANGETLCIPCHSKITGLEMIENLNGKRLCQ